MMGIEKQSLPAGITMGPLVYKDEPEPSVMKQLSQAASLTDLIKDGYTFYNNALFYLTVRHNLYPDPYVAYSTETGDTIKPLGVLSGLMLFNGLINPADMSLTYNNLLMMMPKTQWDSFEKWLGTAAYSDKEKGRVSRIRMQDIECRDYKLAKLTDEPHMIPRIPVRAWVIETNHGSFYFKKPRTDDPMGRWEATFNKDLVYLDTQFFQQELSKDSPDPYQAKGTDGEKQP